MTNEDVINDMLRKTFPNVIFCRSINEENKTRAIHFSEEWLDEEYKEPKTGHREYNDIYDHYLCENCKTVVMDYDNYCPNCGAKMEDKE